MYCKRAFRGLNPQELGGGTGGNAEGFSKMQQIDNYYYDTLHRLTTVDYNTGGVTGDEVHV